MISIFTRVLCRILNSRKNILPLHWLIFGVLMISSSASIFGQQCPWIQTGLFRVCPSATSYVLTAQSICPSGASCSQVTMHRWYTAQVGGTQIPVSSQQMTAEGLRTSITVSQLGNYWVEGVCGSTVTARVSARVEYGPDTPIVIQASEPAVEVCNSSFSLTALYASNFSWWRGDPDLPGAVSLGNATTIFPTTSGDYYLKGYTQCNTLLKRVLPVAFAPVMTVSQISGPTSRCQDAGTAQFSVYTSNADESNWSIQAGNSSISTAGIVTWDPDFVGTATIKFTATGCNASQRGIIERFALTTVMAEPEVETLTQNPPGPVIRKAPGTFSAQASGERFEWSATGGATISATGTSAVITWSNFEGIATVTLKALGCNETSIDSKSITVDVKPIQNNYNYIRVTSVLEKDHLTPESVDALPAEGKSVTTQYFDGLGRPMETVIKQGSPLKNDLVTPIVYDRYGREHRKYLPFMADQQTGHYIPIQFTEAGDYTHDFYDNPSQKIAMDNRPFSEIEFDNSPLNRVLKELGPGEAWKTDNKVVTHGYATNRNGIGTFLEKIIVWTIDASGLPLRTYNGSSPAYYETGALHVKRTIDEEGHEVREYTDKLGRLILKKVYAGGDMNDLNNQNNWAQTYYIYDDFGNLVVVLPPEAVKALIN